MERSYSILVLGVTGAIFVVLASFARHYSYFQWDIPLAHWIQAIVFPGFRELMLATSWMGTGATAWWITIIAGVGLLVCKRVAAGVIVLLGVGAGALANRILKAAIGRPRPTDELIQVLIDYPNLSFPSGHVVFYMQFFGFLLYLLARQRKPGWQRSAAMFLVAWPITLVGVSRVYLGAHWPSDVLAGYLVGGIALLLMALNYERFHSLHFHSLHKERT